MEAGDVQRRMDALGKLVHATRPEFIALQSVTHDMVKKLATTPWGARYKVALPPIKFETRGKPSVAILSTYPVEKSESHVFKDSTRKSYFLAFFVMYDRHKQPHFVTLGTTQLETGLDMSEVREVQVNQTLLSMDGEDCFAVGDFSLTDLDGKVRLQNEWKDAWVELNGEGGDTGNTLDPESNPLLQGDEVSRGRPDRILYRACRYKLESVEVIGKEPVSGVGVHVSSHFAVLASFSILEPSSFLPFTEQGPVACVFERPQWSLSFQSNQ